MTAETLKPFITPNIDFPSAHATKRRPLSSNLIAIALTATCVTLAIIMVFVAIWNTIRICELQTKLKTRNDVGEDAMRISELETKLKTLNDVVEDMQKRLGMNYLEDISNFEKEYANALIDDPTSVDNVDSDDDEDEDNDDDEDDDYDEEDADDDEDGNDDTTILNSELTEEDYEELIKKYQDYERESDDYGSNASDDDNLYDDFEKYKDSKKKKSSQTPRDKRAIANASNGLPVYEASFLEKLNKTEENLPTKELMKASQPSMQNEQHTQHHSRKPVMRYDWSDWSDRLAQNANADEVNKQGDNYKRYIVSEKRHERRYSPLRHQGHNRRRKFPMIKSGESLISAKSTAESSTSFIAAAHFHLDRKVPNRHAAIKVDSYAGDMYIGTPSWSNGEQFFHVENGVLTAKEAGLYYIYAQVCYNNSHDQNGFVIFHGHKPYLQCLNTVPTNMPLKIHTCHTSGLIYLGANETIHLRDFHSDRNAILKDTNNRSYFGLIKI